MPEEFHIFQKFTDIETASEFTKELDKSGIKYILQRNNKSSIGNFDATSIDFDIAINLRSEDFPKAEKVLERYYDAEIDCIDSDYYLFDFSTEELHAIINKPYEWGQFDYQLAKKILAKRGETITEITVQNLKNETIRELSKTENVSSTKIIVGYILSVVLPVIGIIIGLGILNNSKILPNGQKMNAHPAGDLKHGRQILIISVTCLLIVLVIKLLF